MDPGRCPALVPPATAPTAATTAATLGPRTMLPRRAMPGLADIPSPIPCLIPLEMVERTVACRRRRAAVAVSRIVPVIHVSVKSMPATEPWPRPDKHPASEPVWPIVPVGRAAIRRIVVIPVRASGRNSNADTNLRRRCAVAGDQPNA